MNLFPVLICIDLDTFINVSMYIHSFFFYAGTDESTIKKQEEVLRESQMMIPDTQRRLKAAFLDLKSVIADCEELKEEEDYLNAQKFLVEAEKEIN